MKAYFHNLKHLLMPRLRMMLPSHSFSAVYSPAYSGFCFL